MNRPLAYALRIVPSIKTLTDRVSTSVRDVRLAAALVSLVLSTWCVFLDDVINNDGILYLRTADFIGRGEWQTAFESYKWLFYPLLIAALHGLTGIGLELSSLVLNAGFTALTVVAFISLVRELGGGRSVVTAAAVLVLLFPGINEYRSFVIRDAGYIAFYTVALLLFVTNLKMPRWQLTGGWVAMLVVATLFRVEGFAFLLTFGILQYLYRSTAPPTKIKAAVSVALASMALVVALAWWNLGTLSGQGAGLGGIIDLVQALWQKVVGNFTREAAAIAGAVQSEFLADYASVILIAGIGGIVILRTLDTLTPLYALLIGHALYRGLAFPLAEAKSLWLWFAIVHLAALTAVMPVTFVLPGRLPVALSLTLMVAAPFSVAALYKQWRGRGQGARKKWLFPVVCAALLVTGAEGLYSPTSKSHLKQAGLWLKQNAPVESRIVSNSRALLFYAKGAAYPTEGSVPDWSEMVGFLRAGRWREYDYLGLRVKPRREQEAAELLNALGDPLASFTNPKGDTVWIYDLRHSKH